MSTVSKTESVSVKRAGQQTAQQNELSNAGAETAPALRVLHVIPVLGPGGAERVAVNLLRSFDLNAVSARLCVLVGENAFPERLALNEEPVFLRRPGGFRNPWGTLQCARALRKTIRDFRADVVHSHLWPAARIAAVALTGLDVGHVVHVHDTRDWLVGTSLRDRLMRWITRRLVPRSRTTYLAVSNAVKSYSSGPLALPEHAFRVIPNAVDLDRFTPCDRQRREAGPCEIGMAAGFRPEKGHEHLLAAARLLAERGIEFDLRLAGDGQRRRHCEQLAAEWGLTQRVRFLGQLGDVNAFLAGLDVFVLSSVSSEGLPLSILEAMATGLPVVATDVAGAREVIADQQNGLLVPAGNPGELAAALEQLSGNVSLRRTLGANGLEMVRARYSLKLHARTIETLYRELLKDR